MPTACLPLPPASPAPRSGAWPLSAICLPALLLLCTARPVAADPPRFRVDLGAGLDDYSKNYSDPGFGHHREGTEESGFVQVGYRAIPALTLIAGGEVQTPLQHGEGRINGGFYYGLLENLVVNANVAFAPDRRIIARWDLLLGLDWQPLPWLGLLASARHLDFPSDTVSTLPSGHDAVTSISGGARLDLVRRTTLTLLGGFSHHTGVFGPQGSANSVPGTGFGSAKVGVDLPAGVSVSLGASYGGESRRPFNPGVISAVGAATAGVRWQFAESWAVRVDLVHEFFDDEYLRNGASSAVTVKF